ncbi:putative COQ4 protein, responsible for restoring ubiquinone biosynthesis [Fistulina hepatica ATCC 64428]|uniref:4-hydroxy-3-methoxy-5-polyprenylbenzoate decarboxylase n=1 Tax=Fistulina hepatica ATCC 64428 TaxID=1128425 RepID=A0A0D7AJL9_9AGAR|nr:putative COQ4 protein, responsible for restoring ubiquinone biosynthesis [Fistulina hepatica ATCC 64428]
MLSLVCRASARSVACASRAAYLPTFSSAYSVSPLFQRRNKSAKAYEGHIPLSWWENAVLAVGSACVSLGNPRRGDMVAVCGETTAGPILPRLRDHMLASPEGRQILKDRPRINTHTVDMAQLAKLPEGTFGRMYVDWLERCGVTPDTREPVRYIDDPELAYVMQRSRECHDFYHCINGMPVNVEYEIAVKYFEFANLGLPMAGLAALFGPLRLWTSKKSDAEKLHRLMTEYVPWALKCGASARSLITVYWEKRWEQDVQEMKLELGLWDTPPVVWHKPLSKAKVAVEEAQQQPV